MNVYAVSDPIRRQMVVYVEVNGDPNASGLSRWFSYVEDGSPMVMEVAAGAEPPAYMRVDMRIAEHIAEALAPRPEATERHLDDAIAIRDRLLSLVEKAHDGWKP